MFSRLINFKNALANSNIFVDSYCRINLKCTKFDRAKQNSLYVSNQNKENNSPATERSKYV